MFEGNFDIGEFDPKGKLTLNDGSLRGFGWMEKMIKLQYKLKTHSFITQYFKEIIEIHK